MFVSVFSGKWAAAVCHVSQSEYFGVVLLVGMLKRRYSCSYSVFAPCDTTVLLFSTASW
jgi:hypothetical protein